MPDSEAEHAADVRALPYEWRSADSHDTRRFATREECVAYWEAHGGYWFERRTL